jgi:hypothetical protein
MQAVKGGFREGDPVYDRYRCQASSKSARRHSIAGDDIKRVIMLLYEIFYKEEGQESKNPRAWR